MHATPSDLDSFMGPGGFFEILASTYGPGRYGPGTYGSGPFITLKNFLSQICFRTIFEKHTYGAVYISNVVLKCFRLRKFFQII